MYSVGFRYRHIGSINKYPRSKRPVAVSNPGNCERLRKGFKRNDLQSQRQIARTSGISQPTVRRILKNQLDMRVSKYYRGQWLTRPVMRSRVQKCKILLDRNHRVVLFTDEKLY
ncbi:hypothetical protein Ddc_16412 [Ditylenchus destructor]|nr:hypothetical protein Ddc_16412 [Ditylenchus destructor]